MKRFAGNHVLHRSAKTDLVVRSPRPSAEGGEQSQGRPAGGRAAGFDSARLDAGVFVERMRKRLSANQARFMEPVCESPADKLPYRLQLMQSA